jgi:hypothetical protein
MKRLVVLCGIVAAIGCGGSVSGVTGKGGYPSASTDRRRKHHERNL